ncbi:hypothetical protein [Roseivirga seohaensis]|nr:hypothetical protein [Roseivirga seohaensis]
MIKGKIQEMVLTNNKVGGSILLEAVGTNQSIVDQTPTRDIR